MTNQREDICRASHHIFIIRDASDAENIRTLLEQNGYGISTEPKGGEAFHRITDAVPDATVVEVQSPGQQRNSAPTVSHAKGTRERDALQGNYDSIIGNSQLVFKMLRDIEDFAQSPASVLISGETGTGKELVVHALHQNGNHHPKKEVSVIDCAAAAESLIENELFGHEKGAFTGADTRHIGLIEEADGGTLFFDEIGELSLRLQAKLLRVLQEREIRHLGGTKRIRLDIRIVAATNRNLEEEVEKGRFRHDLYQRLNVLTLHVPSLRERREDILTLAEHFLATKSPLQGYEVGSLSPEVLAIFQAYAWPGNIRELEHTMIYAIVRAKGDVILPKHLPAQFQGTPAHQVGTLSKETPSLHEAYIVNFPLSTTLNETIKAVEKACIADALVRTDGNRTQAANDLGIKIRTLHNKLKSHEHAGKRER